MKNKFFIFDFDSTFIKVESLNILAEIALADHPKKIDIIKDIDHLTEQTMAGQYSFAESLQQRIKLLPLNKSHIQEAQAYLKNQISTSIQSHRAFFKKYQKQIYIISGGFLELILPIARDFHIPTHHVFANKFSFDYEGQVTGIDPHNPLSQDQGKVKLMHQLALPPEQTIVIGDGYNDYEIKEAGLVKTFFAYAENVERESVIQQADAVLKDLNGLFLLLNIDYKPTSQSKKVLLLENIHPSVVQYFQSEGYQVETCPKALDEDLLLNKIKDIHILGIRSKTQVSEKILAQATKLEAIGAFCIGTNQISISRCQQQGVAVFNAPFSNTRSVVELTLAEMILLMRRAALSQQKMSQGIWDKSAKQANEIRGKILGIIGYGNIGSQLSILAEALGMQVIYYDVTEKLPLGNSQPLKSMNEVLTHADIVSIHVDGRKDNFNLIGQKEFNIMKPGSVFLNLSRGSVVDEDALITALKSKHLKGAGLDVYHNEPHLSPGEFESPLAKLDNVFLTPHIGGSTEEAQKHIGEFVSKNLHHYSHFGASTSSVNFPQIDLPALKANQRILHIHNNTPGVLAKINNILANFKNNIEGQFLKTNEQIGYVITDINHAVADELILELENIPNTIRVRKLS
tara:strand:+ start:18960 stop:20846 length:1887 start_codon:yes stop_codon:yes gene_type:complete